MLFLGIGTQKAGTTWLHQYFVEHPEVAVPPDKEIHYLDVRYGPGHMKGILRRRREKVANAEELGLPPAIVSAQEKIIELCEQGDDQAYAGYLRSFCGPETKAFGEITPSYCVLSKQAWLTIAEQLPDAKIVFLMRDPIMRLFSAAKMSVRDNGGSLEEAFNHMTHDIGHERRTNYHYTLDAVESAFGKGQVFVGFYEALFSDAAMIRLCRFLGIKFLKPNYAQRENASSGTIDQIPPYLLRMARSRYDPVYKKIATRYPLEVSEYWYYASMRCC